MTPPKKESIAEDPKKIYIVQEERHIVAYLRSPHSFNPRRLRSVKLENVEFGEIFIRHWRQVAVESYCDFDNCTAIII